MRVIGVTGPTGAGKSTVSRVLACHGYESVDCDKLYYELINTDKAFKKRLTEAFGTIFLPDGTLNRAKLAARVFSDAEELGRLNGIVYPVVYAAVEQKIKKCSQKGLAIDAINLVESGIGELCELRLGVVAPPEVRQQRIMSRDGLDAGRAALRIAAQKPDGYYREHCDLVLENAYDSPLEFERQVEKALADFLGEEGENDFAK